MTPIILLPASNRVAEIPVFDWAGPQFLAFYAAAFVLTYLWSNYLVSSGRSRFELPHAPATLTDPYEIAFLAGDTHRVQELAVLRMIKMGLVQWDPAGPRLRATGTAATADLNPLELAVLSAVQAAGPAGWSAARMKNFFLSYGYRIETALAAKGLRPTAADLQKTGHGALLPLQILMATGVIKLLLGIIRDRPVGFLIVFLAATLVAYFHLLSRSKRPGLTPAGRRALGALQSQPQTHPVHPGEEDFPAWSNRIALLGGVAVGAAAEYYMVSRWMNQDRVNQLTAQTSLMNSGSGNSATGGGSSCNSSSDSGGGSSRSSSSDSGGGSSCSSSSDSGGSSCGSSGCGGCSGS